MSMPVIKYKGYLLNTLLPSFSYQTVKIILSICIALASTFPRLFNFSLRPVHYYTYVQYALVHIGHQALPLQENLNPLPFEKRIASNELWIVTVWFWIHKNTSSVYDLRSIIAQYKRINSIIYRILFVK